MKDRRRHRGRAWVEICGALAWSFAALGCGSHSTPNDHSPGPRQSWFEEMSVQNGLTFTHQSGHDARFLMPEIMGGGVAVFDMDNDGDLDVYFVQSGSLLQPEPRRAPNRLFENDGGARFRDVTQNSGADDRGYGMGVAVGDFDNDGDSDLYVTNVGPNVLLRNEGGGRFLDVTERAGVGYPGWSSSAAFVDYDADGDLDLFVANYVDWSADNELVCFDRRGVTDYCTPNAYGAPLPDTLYRNDGDGRFTDVSREAGLRTAFGNGLGVVCADFNRDGRVDIFVANDKTENQLWLNRGDGSFRNVAHERGCAIDVHGQPKAGMGTDAVDVDDDGDSDLIVVNLKGETDSFFRNEGDYFVDDTAVAGLGSTTRPFTRFGMGWQDFDNDGRLDLYFANGRVGRPAGQPGELVADKYAEPNVLMRGNATGRYTEVLPRGGTDGLLVATSRAAAFADLDNDGGIDIIVVNRDGPAYFLRNTVAHREHWITLRVLDEHGRAALGASVTLKVADQTITREVRTAYSYCAANDHRVHLGLGEATSVQGVTVQWVDGSRERFGAFAAGQIVVLKRTSGSEPSPSGS